MAWSSEECKHIMAMLAMQCISAANTLLLKVVLAGGMKPMVYIVYRQAIATLVLIPTTIIFTRKHSEMALGWSAFSLVFITSLFSGTMNQYLFNQGLNLASSSFASATSNIVPATTFMMAASVGLEKVKPQSLRSMAKVFGTIISVGGAVFMTTFKGKKLLNVNLLSLRMLQSNGEEGVIGCIFLLASSCSVSIGLILQAPICKRYLEPLPLATWMCSLSTVQSAILAFYLVPNLSDWKINSIFNLLCCSFSAIFASAVIFYLQSWSISLRGPLYCAMFNPLSTVLTTTVSVTLLHEELHVGILIGGAAVVIGLYVVLWGKAEEFETENEQRSEVSSAMITDADKGDCENDLKESLLNEFPEM